MTDAKSDFGGWGGRRGQATERWADLLDCNDPAATSEASLRTPRTLFDDTDDEWDMPIVPHLRMPIVDDTPLLPRELRHAVRLPAFVYKDGKAAMDHVLIHGDMTGIAIIGCMRQRYHRDCEVGVLYGMNTPGVGLTLRRRCLTEVDSGDVFIEHAMALHIQVADVIQRAEMLRPSRSVQVKLHLPEKTYNLETHSDSNISDCIKRRRGPKCPNHS